MEITCTVTCLNHVDTGRYAPGLSLVVTEIGIYKEFQGEPGANDDLYRDIEYLRPSLCSQTNSYMMQYSYHIYPTIKMDRTVVRCGVHFSSQARCWGEPVVVIQYINPTMNDSMDCTPSLNNVTDRQIGSELQNNTTRLPDPTPIPDPTPCDPVEPTINGVIDGQMGGGLQNYTTPSASDPDLTSCTCSTHKQIIIVIGVLLGFITIIAAAEALWLVEIKYQLCRECIYQNCRVAPEPKKEPGSTDNLTE